MKATFAAGCFWGVEAVFRKVKGVRSSQVGYMGGTLANPNYQDVCTGLTGHAEVVQLEYDPNQVSYETLLNLFWENHDPTSLNQQGADRGTQYRSAIFFHTQEQQRMAQSSKDQLEKSGHYQKHIVTEITGASQFYPAEEYHQQYLEKQGIFNCFI